MSNKEDIHQDSFDFWKNDWKSHWLLSNTADLRLYYALKEAIFGQDSESFLLY